MEKDTFYPGDIIRVTFDVLQQHGQPPKGANSAYSYKAKLIRRIELHGAAGQNICYRHSDYISIRKRKIVFHTAAE